MLEKLRQKLLEFIYSDKDVPLLAGFSVGLYVILFYYSKNFALANSLLQLLFFIAYYIILPIAVLYFGYRLLKLIKFEKYKRNFLFVGLIGFFTFYFLEINMINHPRRILLGVFVVSCVVSFWLKNYYKLLIVLLFLMTVFNLKPLAKIAYISVTSNNDWQKQPDKIETAIFKKRPNIYYIQPDGYVGFNTLKDSIYRFDNTVFESFLKNQGYTLYPDYRSNYFSTLTSNSSMFSMKQHYLEKDVDMYAARGLIVSDNAVLRTLKHNKYKTSFITEKPYLVMNRPDMGYDYCNINYSDLPFIKDGWNDNHDTFEILKGQMGKNGSTGNFYFIEKFSPGHIHGFEAHSEGAESEKNSYIKSLKEANDWLTQTLTYIEEKDPEAIIIIGADHGGFAGFKYTLESLKKTTDSKLVNSVFRAALAIKWNDAKAAEYNVEVKSAVNLFRVVFSFLSENKNYLNHTEDNSSYIYLSEPKGLYKYIDNEGKVVFEKINDVQD